jgi:hypothetical protein
MSTYLIFREICRIVLVKIIGRRCLLFSLHEVQWQDVQSVAKNEGGDLLVDIAYAKPVVEEEEVFDGAGLLREEVRVVLALIFIYNV